MSRAAIALIAGAALAALAVSGRGQVSGDRVLCVGGHPARRAAVVTYGGLAPRHGYERDHCRPLGLGGEDVSGNVWYQPWPEARRKDAVEWSTIEAYCRGEITLEAAWARFPAERCRAGMW